jgi:hypothetical protein
MQQDWSYYIYFAAAAALFALFMRARRRDGSQVAVICSIVAVIGMLVLIAAVNR